MIQFMDGRFKNEHDLTIGVEFGQKAVTIDRQTVKIQMWDTAGQESFKSITRSYYRGAVAALLLFDVTNRESFENLSRWIGEAKSFANKDVSITLVGNKVDLSANRVVSTEEAQKFAEEHNMLFIEASAKDGYNVDETFVESAKGIISKIENGEYDLTNQNSGIKLGPSYAKPNVFTSAKKQQCCK